LKATKQITIVAIRLASVSIETGVLYLKANCFGVLVQTRRSAIRNVAMCLKKTKLGVSAFANTNVVVALLSGKFNNVFDPCVSQACHHHHQAMPYKFCCPGANDLLRAFLAKLF